MTRHRSVNRLRLLIVIIGITWACTALGAPPVEVMVLGTYHMGNPGQDLHNLAADDVLTSRRQAELAFVVRTLAAFRPTVIAVERVSDPPEYVDSVYAAFEVSQLAAVRDERVQIGYRLAHELGLPSVRGIDEQPADREPDYFPFERVQDSARAHGESAELESMLSEAGRAVDAFGQSQATRSVTDLLIAANDPHGLANPSFYYELLALDVGEDQPAAELFGYWTMRNAKIFAKLLDVVRPGDRVLVLFGAGHKHWLEQLVAGTPQMKLVDPIPYLRDSR
jgi:hypothetical protein